MKDAGIQEGAAAQALSSNWDIGQNPARALHQPGTVSAGRVITAHKHLLGTACRHSMQTPALNRHAVVQADCNALAQEAWAVTECDGAVDACCWCLTCCEPQCCPSCRCSRSLLYRQESGGVMYLQAAGTP